MLLFDVGNSRCKWAYVVGDKVAHRGAVGNIDWSAMMNELAALPMSSRVLASNVAGDKISQRLRDVYPSAHFVTAQTEQCGVKNLYDTPSQLGSDRWAALIAAWHKTQRACLVVNCGTATTIDALSAQGEFIGGVILPGMTLMQQSLLQGTAQLVEIAGSVQNFPHNTADAIQSGLLRATVGAIEHQYKLLARDEVAICVLSGGAALHIKSYLNMPVQLEESLVLDGLQIIGESHAW
ncbi:MAG: type III pantothenate kinase [Gallionellaceae bacterium]|nr:type III pantothenate kinase [Gallionellaceae bacterium]